MLSNLLRCVSIDRVRLGHFVHLGRSPTKSHHQNVRQPRDYQQTFEARQPKRGCVPVMVVEWPQAETSRLDCVDERLPLDFVQPLEDHRASVATGSGYEAVNSGDVIDGVDLDAASPVDDLVPRTRFELTRR